MINSNDESRIALQRIKYLKDISKHDYDYLCGIALLPKNYLTDIVTGKSVPTWSMVKDIGDRLNIDSEYFFEEDFDKAMQCINPSNFDEDELFTICSINMMVYKDECCLPEEEILTILFKERLKKLLYVMNTNIDTLRDEVYIINSMYTEYKNDKKFIRPTKSLVSKIADKFSIDRKYFSVIDDKDAAKILYGGMKGRIKEAFHLVSLDEEELTSLFK